MRAHSSVPVPAGPPQLARNWWGSAWPRVSPAWGWGWLVGPHPCCCGTSAGAGGPPIWKDQGWCSVTRWFQEWVFSAKVTSKAFVPACHVFSDSNSKDLLIQKYQHYVIGTFLNDGNNEANVHRSICIRYLSLFYPTIRCQWWWLKTGMKYHKTSSISHTKSQNLNVSCILLQSSLLNPLKPGVKLRWRCSWSSTDRRCSNYIWVINNFIAYIAAYIRGFTVMSICHLHAKPQ